MKKNYRFGFSYIELVFAMAIIVILMVISAPFLTKKNHSQNGSAYGEYQCWAAYEGGNWVLYERSKYNAGEFDFPNGRRVEQCKFMKPVGANEYEVTLISGGGGGSMADFINNTAYNGSENLFNVSTIPKSINFKDKLIEDFNTDIKIYSRNYEFYIKPGHGGESGNVITFQTVLKSFDDDNEIKINLCNTNYKEDGTGDNYKNRAENNKNCVGKGGDGATFNMGNSEGYKYNPTSKINFYKLLSAYDDKIFKESGLGVPYFGTGNGIYEDSEKNEIFINYGLNGSSTIGDFIDELKDYFEEVELPDLTNTGAMGDYTHFLTGVNNDNEYCTSGNCLVPGGKYGETPADDFLRIPLKDCEHHGGGLYCFGTKFNPHGTGRYNNTVAKKGNPAVQIVNRDNSPYIAGCADCGNWSGVKSAISGFGSSLEQVYEPSKTDFGAGGGGGGFIFYTNASPECRYAKSSTYGDIFDPSNEPLKNKLKPPCASLTQTYFLYDKKTFIKRTIGGRGNGGAIIIKW